MKTGNGAPTCHMNPYYFLSGSSPFAYLSADYDPNVPSTWTRAAAAQQVWGGRSDDAAFAWEDCRDWPSAQYWSGDMDELCEIDLAICGRWPR